MSKFVSLKVLGLQLVKLDCVIMYLDLNRIRKARNEPVACLLFSFYIHCFYW